MAQKISQMTAAGALTGDELVEISRLSTTVVLAASTLSALASDNSFNDSADGFIAAGFAVGQQVNVQGFTGNVANNLFSGLITVLTAGKMVIGGTDGDVIVDDAAGESVTITRWETRRATAQDLADLASGGFDLAAAIHAATSKSTPVDADEWGFWDSVSNALRKCSWANIKATVKAYTDTLYQPLAANLTALAGLTSAANKIPRFTGSGAADLLDFSTSTALGSSDTTVASQKAVKDYVDALLAANDAFSAKGGLNCSANPNYPAADAGHVYRVTVAGKIGGASGPNVEINDTLTCYVDGSAAGTHASVGANWTITQSNLDGAALATTAPTNHGIVLGKGTQDLGSTAALTDGQMLVGQTGADPLPKTVSGDGTMAASGALTIANDAVTNAKAANMATKTYKGRTSGSTGDPEDVAVATVRADLGEKVQALTDGATISVDASLANNFRVTLGGNRTLANPTSLIDGQVLNFRISQDGTGSRTLSYGSKYKWAGGTAGVLSTAASTKDFLSCQYDATDDTLFCVLNKAFS